METPRPLPSLSIDNSGEFVKDMFWHWNILLPNSFAVSNKVQNVDENITSLIAKIQACISDPAGQTHVVKSNPGFDGEDYAVVLCDTIAFAINFDTNDGDCFFRVASSVSLDVALKISEVFRDSLSIKPPSTGEAVEFYFWFAGPTRGAKKRRRDLQVPLWADIEENYAPETAAKVESLLAMLDTEKLDSGIVILRGAPGAGKSWFIRAMCRTFANKFSSNYITDLPNMLGSGDYLFDVLMDTEKDDVSSLLAGTEAPPTRGKFVICEDADIILGTNARETSGNNFGTLLNASNGILGQGTRTIFVLSTNKDLDEIDPAILRNGRCIGEIDFVPLPVEQARVWAEKSGMDASKITHPTVLADLYAQRAEMLAIRSKKQERRMGFK